MIKEPETRSWIVKAMLTLPVMYIGILALYILSSGPTRAVSWHAKEMTQRDARGRVYNSITIHTDKRWEVAYAPLIWVSEQSWGKPLDWYWELFPMTLLADVL